MSSAAKTGVVALIIGIGFGWGLHQSPAHTRVETKTKTIVVHDKPEKVVTTTPLPDSCHAVVGAVEALLDPASKITAPLSQATEVLQQYGRGLAPPVEEKVINDSIAKLYGINDSVGSLSIALETAREDMEAQLNKCKKDLK